MGANDDRPRIEGKLASVEAEIIGATEAIHDERLGKALIPDRVKILYTCAENGGWEPTSIWVSGLRALKNGGTGAGRAEIPIATDDQEMPYWLQVWVEDTMPEVAGLDFTWSPQNS